jgi:hypothetical protein
VKVAYQLTSSLGLSYSIGIRGLSMGRSRTNTVHVSDPVVSRVHARILYVRGRYWIRDENSQSGTFVNGRRVMGQQALNTGNILQIGSVTFWLTPVAQSSTALRPSISRGRQNQLIYTGIFGTLLFIFFIAIAGSLGGSYIPPLPGPTIIPTLPSPNPTDFEFDNFVARTP